MEITCNVRMRLDLNLRQYALLISPILSLRLQYIHSLKPLAWYQLSVRHCRCTGQLNVFCPYGAHSSSGGRHMWKQKRNRFFPENSCGTKSSFLPKEMKNGVKKAIIGEVTLS